jgi:AraC-like DNA-binding protein
MDERIQFVDRRLAGEPIAELCREFGISRKTGYKIFQRYQECAVRGLVDRRRRPYQYAHQLPFNRVERAGIVASLLGFRFARRAIDRGNEINCLGSYVGEAGDSNEMH